MWCVVEDYTHLLTRAERFSMALVKRNNTNTNETQNTGKIAWPKTKAKSTGRGYVNQNKTCGQFTGTLQAIRPIQSEKDPTVFAVLDIKVNGMFGVFQDFLHFNEDKEEASISFLINRTLALAESAGFAIEDEEDTEKDINWVRENIEALIEEKAKVNFVQERTERGLDIQYA